MRFRSSKTKDAVLDELESGLEQAAESLVTMREARSRIAEVKKDRKGKPHGNQVPKQKANARCFDCGEPGHWAGDLACSKPQLDLASGKGSSTQVAKQVRATEALNAEHLLDDEATLVEPPVEHEVLTLAPEAFALPLSEVLAQSHGTVVQSSSSRLAANKQFVGALDSARNRTCAGSTWLKCYFDVLQHAPKFIQDLVSNIPENELFRFGNGGAQRSNVRYRLPMTVGSTLMVASLGLLLGRCRSLGRNSAPTWSVESRLIWASSRQVISPCLCSRQKPGHVRALKMVWLGCS